MDTNFFAPMESVGPEVAMDTGFPRLFASPQYEDAKQAQRQRQQAQIEQVLLHALGQSPGSVVIEGLLKGCITALEELLHRLATDILGSGQHGIYTAARELFLLLNAVDKALGGGKVQTIFAKYAVLHLVARGLNVPLPESLIQASDLVEGEVRGS